MQADGAAGLGHARCSASSPARMTDASICGLGQAAANPLKCLMRYFPEEFA